MKKIIKRPVLLIMMLFLVLSMTACGGGSKAEADFDAESVDRATKNVVAIMQHADELGISHLAEAEDEELEEFETLVNHFVKEEDFLFFFLHLL